MCLGLLKISYNLRLRFEESTATLKERLPRHFFNESVKFKTDKHQQCDVELVHGPNKYSLNDIVIVENDSDDSTSYQSFLSNLGTTVSATLVDKSHKYESDNPKNAEETVVLVRPSIRSKVKKPVNGRNDEKIIVSAFDARFKCENCGKQYDREGMFNKHRDKCAANKQIQSAIIDHSYIRSAQTSENDSDDSDTNFPAKNNENTIYKCDHCSKTFILKNRYLKHKKSCNFQCTYCLKVLSNKRCLLRHIQDLHKKKSHPCPHCDFVGRSTSALVYHKLKHFDKQFQCDVCKKKFLTKHILKTHVLYAHERSARDICPVCGKVFHNRCSLKFHLRIHNNDRNYTCTYCPKRFYMLNALKRHLRTHTGNRPYKCTHCDKWFFSSGEKSKHEMIHTGFRPYHCKYCSKAFTSTYNMKVHITTHPGQYRCEICDRTFIDTASLVFHTRTKHGITENNQSNEIFINVNTNKDEFLTEETVVNDESENDMEEIVDEDGLENSTNVVVYSEDNEDEMSYTHEESEDD